MIAPFRSFKMIRISMSESPYEFPRTLDPNSLSSTSWSFSFSLITETNCLKACSSFLFRYRKDLFIGYFLWNDNLSGRTFIFAAIYLKTYQLKKAMSIRILSWQGVWATVFHWDAFPLAIILLTPYAMRSGLCTLRSSFRHALCVEVGKFFNSARHKVDIFSHSQLPSKCISLR